MQPEMLCLADFANIDTSFLVDACVWACVSVRVVVLVLVISYITKYNRLLVNGGALQKLLVLTKVLS